MQEQHEQTASDTELNRSATGPASMPARRGSTAAGFRELAVGFQQQRAVRESTDGDLPQVGRRAREREARRREILDVARRLFAAQGFQGTTLDELATQTEFAKPTLYQYFESKEHLFYTILRDGYGDLESIVRKTMGGGGSSAQQFRTICVMFLIYFRKHLDFFLIHRQFGERLRRDVDNAWHSDVRDSFGEILEGLRGLFESGVGLGEFRPLDAKKLCALFFESVAVYTYAFRDEEELRTAHEMADEIIGLFLDGLRVR